jgi:hypothetical protein
VKGEVMNIPAKYIKMPLSCPGFSVYDSVKEYSIVINSNLPEDEQMKIYNREVENITKGLYVEEIIRSAF